jgi:hypothetical protein
VTKQVGETEAEGTYSIDGGHMEIQWEDGGTDTFSFEKAGGTITIDGVAYTKN